MQLKFTKMHSQGVDIMVTEMLTIEGFVRPQTIARLARRDSGVGFSYFLLIEHPKQADVDFDCRLYDHLGNEVAMNYPAARCAARFIEDNGLTGYASLRLSFGQQVVQVEYADKKQIAVCLPEAEFAPELIGLEVERYKAEYDLPVSPVGQMQLGVLQIGELQAVVRVDEIEQVNSQQLGQQLSQQSYFKRCPQVSFIQTVDEHLIRLSCYQTPDNSHCDHIAAAAVLSAQMRGWLSRGVTVVWDEQQFLVDWDVQQPIKVVSPAYVAFEGRVYI